MKDVTCPITNSRNVRMVEEISVSKINLLYRNLLSLGAFNAITDLKSVQKYESLDTGYCFYFPFTIQGNESLYTYLQKFDWYYMHDKWEYRKAMEYVHENDKVMEIGSGDGAFLEILEKNISQKPEGIELSNEGVKKSLLKGLHVRKSSIEEEAEHRNEEFDTICAFQVLEHLASPKSFLESCFKLLKKGGRLIIAVPNNDSFIKNDRENTLNLPPHHMGLWNQKSLKSIATIFKFEVEAMHNEPLQNYHLEWYIRVAISTNLGYGFYRIVLKLKFIKSLILRIVAKVRHKIKGHTILVVYQKR